MCPSSCSMDYNLSKGFVTQIYYILALLLLVLLCDHQASASCSRKLQTILLNPGKVPHNVSTVNVVHTEAKGHADSIHYIFSTVGIPSILTVRTSTTAKLKVDWDRLLSPNLTEINGSITFSERPYQVLVTMISDVIDYIDEWDTANMKEKNYTVVLHDLSNATWQRASVDKKDTTNHIVTFAVTQDTPAPRLQANGSFSLKFQVHCDKGYSSDLPYLQYNSNLTVIDVVMNNIATVSNKSRLALRLIVADDNPTENMTMVKRKSIDDEHSPGSFVVVNWLGGSDLNTSSSSFLEWKPACYLEADRSIHSLSSSRYYDLERYNFSSPERNLAFGYFGYDLVDSKVVNVATNNISFGLPLDKFYINKEYVVWSFSMGFGKAPEDKISPTIILIIAIGLGIPAVLIVASFIYTCVRRLRCRGGYVEITSSYSEIN